MKAKIAFILILIFLIVSCKKKESFSLADVNAKDHEKYETRALVKGDTIAYNKLSMEFFDSPNEGVFLYTALKMANKYNYGRAYDDAYMCLTDAYHKKDYTELDSLDNHTKSLALDLLKRGTLIRNRDCMRRLGKFYMLGKHVEKDSVKGQKLINEADK